MTAAATQPQARTQAGDAASSRWLTELRDGGRTGELAVGRLHELLLRMAYAGLLRAQPSVGRGLLDELANEAADEAVVRVLAHLGDFRGRSRFTTWACQFALTEASVSLRRCRRRERELPVEPELVVRLVGERTGPERELEQTELLHLVCHAVANGLTERQRAILLATAVDGRSPETVAKLLDTTVGALYKSLHDARAKLRDQLAAHGLTAAGESADVR